VPLPFDLPALSRGFAALSPGARAAGALAAQGAAASLGELLGREVSIRARACAGRAAPRPVAARAVIDLPAVPAAALLEAEPDLVVALVADLAGGPPEVPATSLTPIERAAFELFTLAALNGACRVAALEERLAPRLTRGEGAPPSALAIELELTAGRVTGRGRLLVSDAAVRALGGACGPGSAAVSLIPVSVRSGAAPVAPEELEALGPGDVILLDPPGAGADALVLPGGARLCGRVEGDGFLVEEVVMNERTAQLPIRLEIELARVEISLAELARLEPGAALPLGLDRRGLVTLRVGERAVGRGELVDVDGAVGIRVLEVSP
jgi:type III secretion protein Q